MASRVPASLRSRPALVVADPSKTAAEGLPSPANGDDREPLRLRVVAGPGYWSARAVMKREAIEGERRQRPIVDEEAVLRELRCRMASRGTRKRVAFDLGVAVSTVSQILRRQCPIPERVAERLGFRALPEIRRRLFERVE